MANEFIIKNGFRSQGNSEVTGSLNVTGGITGSFSGSLSAPGSNSQIIFNNAGTLAGANNVYFRTNGRLGIGTDSPLARLGISGSSSDILLKLDSDSSSSILYISGSGRVGIGTSTPTSTLHSVGSFLNELTPTSLKIQSDLSSSFGVGSTYLSGAGWTPLTLSGSTSTFIANKNNGFTLSGLVDGNVNIPSFGVSFPLNGVLQTLSTGSDLLNLYSQYTDTTALGGTPQLSSGLSSTFSGSDGYNLYRFQVYKNLSTNSQSLSIEKINNAGESIQFGLENNSSGFNIFSTLSQPTSSLFKMYSGSTSLIDFRYDYNQIKQATVIGGGDDSNGTRLTVLGYGTTLATRGINITNGNGVSLFSVSDNGAVAHGAMAYAAGAFSHATG